MNLFESNNIKIEPNNLQVDIVLGDLIEIGEHRLLCDSSTDHFWRKATGFTSLCKEESVDLIVTSPPYNKKNWLRNKSKTNGWIREIEYSSYDDNLPQEEYVRWQKQVIAQCLWALKPSGSLFYNHIDIMSKHLTIHPTWVYDFPLKQVIIWDKCGTPKLDESYFLPFTEWIFWIKKDKDLVPYFDRNSALLKKNIWSIPRSQEANHPAPFPEKMVTNIVMSCSKPRDLVFDPYIGSGTTMVVAHQLNRKCYGIEIDPKYCQLIIHKMKKLDPSLQIKINGNVYKK
tara:strand:- start:87 stop:944 length:858 start_codon:yes stop_codon:yes gene_type:complete